MNRKYLVAWDFGSGARAALRQAAALAGEDAVIILEHVAAPGTAPSVLSALEDRLDDEVAVLRELGRDARIRVDLGSVTDMLVEVLEAEHPDLVLVGRRRTSGARGRLARELVRRTRTPVLSISSDAALDATGVSSVVVGIDFGPASEAAYDEAARLARRLRVPMRLVHARAPSDDGPALESEPAAAKLEDLVERLHAVGLDASFTVAFGNPASAIVSETRGEPGAVVVVGTRDRGAVKRTFLGSVAEKVLATARCAVLIAKEPPPPETSHRATWMAPAV